MSVWSQNPWVGWSPNPSGVPIPSTEPIPGMAPAGPTLNPSHPIEAAILTCPARGPARGGCSCPRCAYLQGELGRVDPIVCYRCQQARLWALPAPR